MNNLTTPIQFGKLALSSRVFYAPLAGCSDFPFRKMSAQYRPALMYCEMVKMDALVRHDKGTLRMLDYSADMRPIGAQICGCKPAMAAQAASLIEDLGFDVIDLNCGCPVYKVTKDGSGSKMLETPDLIGDVLANMVASVKIPVTVKIRSGWDDAHINAPQIVKIAEQAGAKAICVHGRTREQAYRGPANWDHIRACKEAASSIIVIGNGDICDASSAEKMVAHTQCDAVLVARGTMGQPWIVEDILRSARGEAPIIRTSVDHRKALFDHFLCIQSYYKSDHRVLIDMRRVGCWYLKNAPGMRRFREAISRADSVETVRDVILNFPLEADTKEMFQGEASGDDAN